MEWNIYDGNNTKKHKIMKGNTCKQESQDGWFFGEIYSNGYKMKQVFYENGKLKYEGIYIGDKKWKGIKYDEDGENQVNIYAGEIVQVGCIIF